MKTRKISEKVLEMHGIKKYSFFNKYKMININSDTYAKNCVHTKNVIEKTINQFSG